MPPPPLVSHTRLWDQHRREAVDWTPPAVATTVVVPHPDDEALLFGGLIQHQRQQGVEVHVIAVTDGEAAYPDTDPNQLAHTRRREQHTSLGLLGIESSAVTRLALPDGQVAAHETALEHAIVDVGHLFIVAPWVHDHHCDHEACGRAANAAAHALGGVAMGGLFWAWHHTAPEQLTTPLSRIHLNGSRFSAKRAAIDAHVSQLSTETPILDLDTISPATTAHEYYVAAPGSHGDETTS